MAHIFRARTVILKIPRSASSRNPRLWTTFKVDVLNDTYEKKKCMIIDGNEFNGNFGAIYSKKFPRFASFSSNGRVCNMLSMHGELWLNVKFRVKARSLSHLPHAAIRIHSSSPIHALNWDILVCTKQAILRKFSRNPTHIPLQFIRRRRDYMYKLRPTDFW